MKRSPRLSRFESRSALSVLGILRGRTSSYHSDKPNPSPIACTNGIRTIEATGYRCSLRTHPLSPLWMSSRIFDAHLKASSNVRGMDIFASATTSECLCPGQNPSLKINHNVNLIQHSVAAFPLVYHTAYPRSGKLERMPAIGTYCPCTLSDSYH